VSGAPLLMEKWEVFEAFCWSVSTSWSDVYELDEPSTGLYDLFEGCQIPKLDQGC
jgi:hypothetical protein